MIELINQFLNSSTSTSMKVLVIIVMIGGTLYVIFKTVLFVNALIYEEKRKKLQKNLTKSDDSYNLKF